MRSISLVTVTPVSSSIIRSDFLLSQIRNAPSMRDYFRFCQNGGNLSLLLTEQSAASPPEIKRLNMDSEGDLL
ncbi:hypothetical protein VIM7927_00929 [Vibrio mangrovi]|uniref:Uncharacterized protein n=1 Tax=Vibrio mangrovi TaxID=474394 RepID=A0A1Y6IRM9_9VIBR|nr:hypothetical protein VIM7927_00929 [Vibrio mangrovi]